MGQRLQSVQKHITFALQRSLSTCSSSKYMSDLCFPWTHNTVKYIQLHTPSLLSLLLSLLPYLGSFKVPVLECSHEMLTSYWLLDGIIRSGVLTVGLLQ